MVFWHLAEHVSEEFLSFFDHQSSLGNVMISSVSFWEVSLLVKKGRLEIQDLQGWKNEILEHSRVRLVEPTVDDMIDSTLLPDHHKDPFDRLLAVQAQREDARLVTRDTIFTSYGIDTYWI